MAAARKPIADFREFIDGVNDARADQYLGGSHSSIVDEEAFNEIQAHLRDYYTGVEPVHSFLDTNGTVFDCIPLAQQYSLRSHKGRLPQPPELPAGFAQPSDDMSKRVIQLHDSFIDRLGNQMYCPDGTIPVQRLTLPWLARFPDLAAFRRKYHARIRRPLPPVMRALPSITALHQYATAEQLAANIGGGAILNVWDPQPVYPPQLMSLSQVWFTSIDRRQTVEAGWQVNPYRYGGNKPVLFTFWTADAYSSTGCYNLTCPAFVQTNNHWMLGGALPDWSSTWGPQIELAVAWHLQGGNWWLYVDGIEVGYFPISIFNHGPMAAGAVRIVCGGETTTTDNTSWAPMGSGELAAAEQFSLVAYQRQIQYIAPGGVTHDANLTVTPNGFPACYTAITTTYPAPWNETLWFGGRPPAACLCT